LRPPADPSAAAFSSDRHGKHSEQYLGQQVPRKCERLIVGNFAHDNGDAIIRTGRPIIANCRKIQMRFDTGPDGLPSWNVLLLLTYEIVNSRISKVYKGEKVNEIKS
jgi:hypothetical protein